MWFAVPICFGEVTFVSSMVSHGYDISNLGPSTGYLSLAGRIGPGRGGKKAAAIRPDIWSRRDRLSARSNTTMAYLPGL